MIIVLEYWFESHSNEKQAADEERALALLYAQITAKRAMVIALKAVVAAKQAIADAVIMQKQLEGGQQNETRPYDILSTCLFNGSYDIGDAGRVMNAIKKKRRLSWSRP